VGAAIGELEVFQEQVDCHQLPPMEEISQFCQAVKWKDETSNICCRSGKVVLVSLHDPLQESKQLFKDPLFLVKVRSFNSIFAFTSMGVSLTENARIASNWQMIENVFRVLETLCHCVGTLLNIESRTSSAQSYVFDSGVEAQENMRRCSLVGLN